MKIRVHFYVRQLHQLELDPAHFPGSPQDDADAFVDWLEAPANWRAHSELLDRTDPVRSWVDTDDEITVESYDEVSA